MSTKPICDHLDGADTRPEDRRQHRRRTMFWTGKLSCESCDDTVISVNLMDISAGGARVMMAEPWYGCAAVKLTIDRIGEFAGQVVWEGSGDVGIRFVDPGYDSETHTPD